MGWEWCGWKFKKLDCIKMEAALKPAVHHYTQMVCRILTSTLLFLLLLRLPSTFACHGVDRDSLIPFFNSLSLPFNSSSDCCGWPGVTCAAGRRVTHLSLPGRGLSGPVSPSIGNLSFLVYLNLSQNILYGPSPFPILSSLRRLQVLDLSFNRFVGPLWPNEGFGRGFGVSIKSVDVSSNLFNGSIDPSFLYRGVNLVSFNFSNNGFSGQIPTEICFRVPGVEVLDFSGNEFSGEVSLSRGECANLRVFRVGFNSLTGNLPEEIFRMNNLTVLSFPGNRLTGTIDRRILDLLNLRILELHFNGFNGEIPSDIGRLFNLQQLLLHNNNFSGTLPPSLFDCTNLTTLLLRNNLFNGEVSGFDFSRLHNLNTIDLGNNSFTGAIPDSLCRCPSLAAVRLAYNNFSGEIPSCMSSMTPLSHFSVSNNYLSNVTGALKTLRHCKNLAVLFMSRCFSDEQMPDDDDLRHFSGFQGLQILTLGGCKLSGQIPYWISNLRKLKVLNLSYNNVSGPIPPWLGDMPSLFVLNLTQNHLSGELPRELGGLRALTSDNSSSDLSYLALPFLSDSLQYNTLFNLKRGLKVGNNNLSGPIPIEIGNLKLLHILDLSFNSFNGEIPDQLSGLVNLERLDLSDNRLTGEIPESLTKLHFLSWFSVANNDLDGEIPEGSQFATFPVSSFSGNPKLCGFVLKKSCGNGGQQPAPPPVEEQHSRMWSSFPFLLGFSVGFVGEALAFWVLTSGRSHGNSSSDERSLL